jgi:hypothetical protein
MRSAGLRVAVPARSSVGAAIARQSSSVKSSAARPSKCPATAASARRRRHARVGSEARPRGLAAPVGDEALRRERRVARAHERVQRPADLVDLGGGRRRP